jgi:hypothetical protein
MAKSPPLQRRAPRPISDEASGVEVREPLIKKVFPFPAVTWKPKLLGVGVLRNSNPPTELLEVTALLLLLFSYPNI